MTDPDTNVRDMLGKRVLVGFVAAAFVVGTAGAAMAVSDGNYDYEKQHCSDRAANSDYPEYTEPDCRTVNLSLWTGPNGGYEQSNEVGSVGIHQAPDGDEGDPNAIPHDALYNGAGATAGDHAAEGVHVYFGADDNLDFGEHDSSEKVDNGPSDGGGIQANVDPASLAAWVAALSSGDAPYLLTHPIPLVSAGVGAGADGIMFSVQTERQVAFEGTGGGERDVADYEGKNWDPETCAGPDDEADACADPDSPKGKQKKQDITYWEDQEGTTYAEPGVQVYEDPDPQASPLGPYPLPAAYVGTCGVIVGGGDVAGPADTPLTNGAGQLAVQTGCTQ